MEIAWWSAVAGLLLLVMALSDSLLARLPLSTSMLYLAAGAVVSPLVFGLAAVEPLGSDYQATIGRAFAACDEAVPPPHQPVAGHQPLAYGERLTPPAELAFRRAAALNPAHPAPAFFYGLARARSGDP